MKLTWFGGTTLRIHTGGRIFVADAGGAPEGIDRAELVSGADRVFSLGVADASLEAIDAAQWRPRRAARVIDEEAGDEAVHLYRIGDGAVLVDAVGEPPAILIAGVRPPRFGRWANDGVVVLFGDGEAISAIGETLLDVSQPKLVVLAADEPAIDHAVDALREHLDGAGLMALEPGLAMEV